MKELTYFKKIRLEMRLTQEEMADRIGISRTAYVKLENGTTHIITDSVVGFAKAAGVPLIDLLKECLPEDYVGRFHDGDDYEEKISTLIEDYEKRLELKDRLIQEKQKLIDSQDETIRVQKQMIAMYEKKSGENQ